MRNTDVSSVLFPVDMADIQYAAHDGITKHISSHKAVVDVKNGRVLGVVGSGYRLITNNEALWFAEDCASQLFGIKTEQLEVFKVYAPGNPWYCQIYLIHKGYEVNFFKQEVYLPFLRVTNSYNGSKALRFDVGYCRKLCSNGMIFEEETIKFKFPHSHSGLARRLDFSIAKGKIKELQSQLSSDFDKLFAYDICEEMSVPLFFKALSLPCMDSDKNMNPKHMAYISDLVHHGCSLTTKYMHEFGPNAYAVFNAITDFASNPPEINGIRRSMHSMQTKAGSWCKEFVEHISDKQLPFKISEYLGDYLRITDIDRYALSGYKTPF